MKNVMVRAWEIARASVARFGGKAREYLSGALRQAWAETKPAVISIVGTKVVMIADDVTRKITSIMAVVDGRIAKTYGPCDTKSAFKAAYNDAVLSHVGFGNIAESYIRTASGALIFHNSIVLERK